MSKWLRMVSFSMTIEQILNIYIINSRIVLIWQHSAKYSGVLCHYQVIICHCGYSPVFYMYSSYVICVGFCQVFGAKKYM